MSGFSWHRRSKRVVGTLTGFQADLLRSLAAQLIELLGDQQPTGAGEVDPLEALVGLTGPTSEPEDPVLARLLPSAYRDDEEAAGEFRRFTETSLREAKSSGARAVIEDLTDAGLPERDVGAGLVIDVELDTSRAQAWLRTLTDLRLALATRLGVSEDDHDYWASLPEEDPRTHAYHIFEWLGYLQETLVEAIFPDF